MLRIAHYRAWEELQELRPHWNALLSRSSSDTVFLTWEWCSAWWKNYGGERKLFVLAVWEAQNPVAIAPLYVDETRLYGKTWRQLRLIGDGSHDSDYLDCFAEAGREVETMAVVADFLQTEGELWDWIELSGPRRNSCCAAALVGHARQKGWKFAAEPIPCLTLALLRNWDDYLRKLEPRFRTKVRSSIGLLNNFVKSAPLQCASERQIEDWLPILFDLHTRRWASEDMPGVFRDTAKRSFYHDLSRLALERGWLAFHRLNWGERPLALQYGLFYANRFHLLQEGYDPDFSSLRPGMALRAWLMRHWIESGVDEYDFLAGVAPHKLDWGAHETSSTRLIISASPSGQFAALSLPRLHTKIRESVARITPAAVLAFRQKVLAGASREKERPLPANAHPNGVKGMARQLAAVAYSSRPVAAAGRAIADRYTWSQAVCSLPIRRHRPAIHILQYHRVNNDRDPFLGGLDVETFRSQMQHMVANFPMVTLDQFAAGDLPGHHKYYAAVTFDDGYRDNFICAFPILKQLGIPATIFLVTGYIDAEQLPWYDQVRLAFKLTTRTRFLISERGGPGGCLNTLSNRLRFMEQTLAWLRRLAESERRRAMGEVFRALGVAHDLNLPNQMLRWEDVRQMSKNNVSFGAHTVTHPVLSRIPASELKQEIEISKQTIENRLQLPVSHFAYPFGQTNDFDEQAKCAVRSAGFKTAVTTVWGLNDPEDDPLELKRFTPWETNPTEFKFRLDWFRFRESQKAIGRTGEQVTASSLAQEAST